MCVKVRAFGTVHIYFVLAGNINENGKKQSTWKTEKETQQQLQLQLLQQTLLINPIHLLTNGRA